MSNNIKIGLVGCGAIGSRHAQEIINKGFKLAGICDIDQQKVKYHEELYQAKGFVDLNEMLYCLPELDLVSICTPNYLHAEQSILCLRSGKHVLCEKPMAISEEDARKMVTVSHETGKKLWVVKQNRFNPPVVFVKRLIDEEKLGKILSFQVNGYWNRTEAYYQSPWRGKKATDGGTLYTQFSHFIDLIIWMLGEVKNISFLPSNALHPYIEFEDTGIISFHMKSGAVGSMHYHVNAFRKNMEGSFTIFGEKGTVKIGGPYLNNLEYQEIEDGPLSYEQVSLPANEYGHYQGSMSNHGLVYQHLEKAILHDTQSLADAHEGLQTVLTIEKIYQSAANF
jgi:UDP-N-acetyl-2-amino-2-deoxyglucuronate dehydrogenase